MEKVRSSKINVSWNDMGIFMILALLIVILSVIRPVFLTPDNIINVIRQVTIVAIIGIGMSFVLISGEIDLSVGSICALSGIIVTMCLRDGFGMTVSILLALCTAALCGAINGSIHVFAKIPSFIVTMGMLNVARGIVLVITNSYSITGLPDSFKVIGRGYVGPIPVPVVIMAVCYVIGFAVLKYTKCGLTAGIAGIILSSRMFSGQPSAGNGLELDAIAACVIGGTSTTGGKGRLWGTFLGALIMGIITNGMNLMNISTNWQLIVQGMIIVIAVGLDRIKSN